MKPRVPSRQVPNWPRPIVYLFSTTVPLKASTNERHREWSKVLIYVALGLPQSCSLG